MFPLGDILQSLSDYMTGNVRSPIPKGEDADTKRKKDAEFRKVEYRYAPGYFERQAAEKKKQSKPTQKPVKSMQKSTNLPKAAPTPTDIPNLKAKNTSDLQQGVESVYRRYMPAGAQGTPLADYYPVAQHLPQIIQTGESIRPGLGVLAALQAFYESTGGRGGRNYWGILPGGEANPGSGGQIAGMPINQQLDYLFGPRALGGGANPNMNVANEGNTTPLNISRINQLYQSYNPSGDYLPGLLRDYAGVMGGGM